MTRTFTITQSGVARTFTVNNGVGPQGATGATGATGSTGPTGPAGPNSVTSATTSDGTASINVASLQVQSSATFEASSVTTFDTGNEANFLGLSNYENSATFTYGATAASAHRTALGLGTLATQDANAATFSGTLTIDSTSFTYGTGAASAHRAALGVVEANPSTVYISDDFAGNTTASPTIGDLGWFSFASGGGSGALIAAPSSTFPNIGLRTITCGNATNAGQVLYLNNWTSIFTYDWECCFVIAATQTTDCDVIAGFTRDNSALGIGKFGGISIGVRYSSATDTNWVYYSKNSNTTFAANDANNYSISSGVAASTAYNTFRIRCTAGVVEMSANGGAWTTVSTASVTLTGVWIPFFYVSTRTTTSKSANIDFFSFKSTGLSR